MFQDAEFNGLPIFIQCIFVVVSGLFTVVMVNKNCRDTQVTGRRIVALEKELIRLSGQVESADVRFNRLKLCYSKLARKFNTLRGRYSKVKSKLVEMVNLQFGPQNMQNVIENRIHSCSVLDNDQPTSPETETTENLVESGSNINHNCGSQLDDSDDSDDLWLKSEK